MKKIIVMMILLSGQLTVGMDVRQPEPLESVIASDMKKSALRMAAEAGNLSQVAALLDQGLDVNAEFNGVTPLFAAALGGHVEVVRLLLDRGANIKAVDYAGWTALMNAAVRGNVEVVRLLLDRGADINALSRGGDTALISAVSHPETVLELLTFIPLDERKAIQKNVLGLLSALKRSGESRDIRQLVGQELINRLVQEEMPHVMARARLLAAVRTSGGATPRDLALRHAGTNSATANLLDLDNPASQAILRRQVEANIRRIVANPLPEQPQPWYQRAWSSAKQTAQSYWK